MNDEPITADALSREPGWVAVGVGYQTHPGGHLWLEYVNDALYLYRGDGYHDWLWLEGVDTMAHLRSVFVGLRGEPDPRIDALDEALEQMSHDRDTAQAQAAYWRWTAYAGPPLHEPVLSVGRATWTGTSFSVYVNRRYHVCRRRAQRYAWAVKP